MLLPCKDIDRERQNIAKLIPEYKRKEIEGRLFRTARIWANFIVCLFIPGLVINILARQEQIGFTTFDKII